MKGKIAIIGGGNLGASVALGLMSSGFKQPEEIIITRRNTTALQHFQEAGATVTDDNTYAIQHAEWIILAVKPFQIAEVISKLLPDLKPEKHKLISVITGVWTKDLQQMLSSDKFTLFRAMPNTAIAINESMTCICSVNATKEQEEAVIALFNQVGKSIIIDEKLMDAATVLGACGTAYAMRYVRANIQGGIEIGFSAKTATLIAAQTVKGAADLLLQQNRHPEEEIDKVTTPKGCTIAGLNEMEHRGFSSSLIRGITTSYKKIINDM